jgi:hypothetical protein
MFRGTVERPVFVKMGLVNERRLMELDHIHYTQSPRTCVKNRWPTCAAAYAPEPTDTQAVLAWLLKED